MSAFIVSRNHIAYLVKAALELPGRSIQGGRLYWFHNGPHQLRIGEYAEAERVGQVLWDENIRSVLHRYPEDTRDTTPGPVDEDYTFKLNGSPHWFPVEPVATLKAVQCLEYQSCEHPEWETSEAKAILDGLVHAAIHALPGYKEAKWEID